MTHADFLWLATQKMNKNELISKVKGLDALTLEEKSQLIDLINRKRYGLVWEDKPEEAEELLNEALPVLSEVKERAIIYQPEKDESQAPNHILIEGDNLHALTSLCFTHENKIDVIYIDPPYNTGNKDFRYYDSRYDEARDVDKENPFRHSMWLSFMSKRMKLAKRLLKDTGVVFISIDDNEQAQLKLLCDEIFGETNFIAELVWKKKQGGGNDSTFFVIEHEYVFCYGKNKDYFKINLDAAHELSDALYPFKDEEGEYGLVTLDKSSIRYSDSLVFEIKDPDGNSYLPRNIKGKKSCWRWGKKKATEEYDKLVFKNGKVYTKYYRPLGVVPKSILYETRFGRTESGKDAINEVLGNTLFSYPKPVELIKHIIGVSSQKESIILDFFAGSGTTLHSTMILNEEDAGKRQCILVTNNENKICEEVTYLRNKKVIEGYTKPNEEKVEGLLRNNFRYYKTAFVSREKTLKNKRELTEFATELLSIKENCYTEIKGGKQIKIFQEKGIAVVIIYDDIHIPAAIELIKKMSHELTIKVYVFAEGQDPYTEDFYEVGERVQLCALPDAIYKAFQNILPKKRKIRNEVTEEV